ncbi:MAG: hypothetical protein ACK5IN_02545 [Microbacterium sp.]|uniref:hypothetical protein n=1 Tax=Microbacterium sp. TaxID=51671 RepID=UPI003A8AE296
MTAYPSWTPASRPGIVPLHPLGFGTILGRSFSALRHNPKVLLGFAMCVQVVAYLVVTLAVGGVALWAFSRLDTLRIGSDEWNAVMAGSVALTAVAGFVLGLAATALTVIVQGVVVADVSRAVVAEKQPLGRLWARVRAVFWRLFGYTIIVTALVSVLVGAVALGLVLLGTIGPAGIVLAVVLGILLVLVAIPLWLWLSTKLALVTAAIVLERATIVGAIARSWVLLRGRFWAALGVIVIISMSFGFLAQAVSLPFAIANSLLSAVVSPTGEPSASAFTTLIVGTLLTQAIVLVVQAVGLIVQSTATSLIYVDCRMRHEGLDIDLQEYVEKRDAGTADLPDPYTPHPDRPHPARPTPQPAASARPPGYPAPPVPPAPPAPSPTQWTAPGAPADDERRDRP